MVSYVSICIVIIYQRIIEFMITIRWPSVVKHILKSALCSLTNPEIFLQLKLPIHPVNYVIEFKTIILPACFRFLSFTAFDMMSNISSSEAPSRSGSLDQYNIQVIQIALRFSAQNFNNMYLPYVKCYVPK